MLHLSEDENLVHFVSLSFNSTPVDITYPSLTTKLWIHLSHRFSSFDEKKEKRNFNHCTREISSRHFFVTFHALSNPIEFSNSRALVEKGRRSFIAHPVSIPFEIGRWRDYLKFGRRRDSINGACLIYGKTMRGSNGSKTGSVDWEYLGTLRFELIEIGRICRVRLLKHVTVR